MLPSRDSTSTGATKCRLAQIQNPKTKPVKLSFLRFLHLLKVEFQMTSFQIMRDTVLYFPTPTIIHYVLAHDMPAINGIKNSSERKEFSERVKT